jgi:serine protease inhibitor
MAAPVQARQLSGEVVMRHRSVALLLVAISGVAAVAAVVLTRSDVLAPEAQAQPALGRADPQSAAAKALVRPLDAFGLALLRRQAAVSPDGNVVVSPASMHAVLAALLNGATGETAAEMRRALAVGGLAPSDVNRGWADLIWLAQSGRKQEVKIRDSLWLRAGFPFKQAFLDADRDYFAAETQNLPQSPDAAAQAINDWVERNTAGRIKDIVQPDMFNSATVLALFNTVYLKVKWDHFDETATADEPFTLADGRQAHVPMMHATELETQVAQTDSYDAVALTTDGPVTVWIIVPRDDMGAEALLGLGSEAADGAQPLDAAGLQAMQANAKSLTGSLALPRFTTRYEAKDLKGTLAAMGMPRAFSSSEAEFDGVADVAPQRLFISEVVQKTFVEMNEEGAEAAAGSGALMEVTSMPALGFDVRADHPFLFAITEKATGAPLFLGLMRDPS